jgi:hypothetical protein
MTAGGYDHSTPVKSVGRSKVVRQAYGFMAHCIRIEVTTRHRRDVPSGDLRARRDEQVPVESQSREPNSPDNRRPVDPASSSATPDLLLLCPSGSFYTAHDNSHNKVYQWQTAKDKVFLSGSRKLEVFTESLLL